MKTLRAPRIRRIGAASSFIERRLTEGRVAFPLTELMQESGLSLSAARNQLLRLGARLVRVSPSQQFFLIVGPEHRSRGSPPVEWWLDDYFRWLGHPYYLALLSAASAHGSNPQAIQITQVMTDSPRRALAIGQLRVCFIVKRRVERTRTQALPNAQAPIRVSTPAATAFDLVRYASRIGGIGRAVETLQPLLSSVTHADLRAVLDAEQEPPTAQRLGYVIEQTGHRKLADVVDTWLPKYRRPIPLATTTATLPGTPPNRWRVWDNSGEFHR